MACNAEERAMEDRFDALAKALNGEVSRRGALKRLAGGLAAMLASLFGFGRKAQAQGPGDCTTFCNSHFPPGLARDECLEVCKECNSDPTRVCGDANNLFCCPDGTVCINGACCPKPQACGTTSTQPFCCPQGTYCIDGKCCPRERVCHDANHNLICCPEGSLCIDGRCCPRAQICGTSTKPVCCPDGTVCINGVCCPKPRVCGTS